MCFPQFANGSFQKRVVDHRYFSTAVRFQDLYQCCSASVDHVNDLLWFLKCSDSSSPTSMYAWTSRSSRNGWAGVPHEMWSFEREHIELTSFKFGPGGNDRRVTHSESFHGFLAAMLAYDAAGFRGALACVDCAGLHTSAGEFGMTRLRRFGTGARFPGASGTAQHPVLEVLYDPLISARNAGRWPLSQCSAIAAVQKQALQASTWHVSRNSCRW